MTSGHFDDNGNWVEDNTVSGNTTTSTTPLTGDPSEVKPNKAQQKAINKINAFADDTVFTGKTDVPKDTNLEDFNFPVYENQDAEGIRAKNQSGWDQAGNFLTQSILGEVLGGAIQGAGSIAEIPRAIINEFGEDNYDFNNFIIQLGKNIKESTQDKFPIYREKPNESFDISDPAWWWSNGVSVASTLSLLIPAMGEAKLAGAAAKGLGTLMETYKVFDSLNKVGKAGENINLLGRVGKALEAGLDTRNYWTNLAHSAVTMRNAENFMEAGQVFTDSKNKALGKWQSEQDFQTWLNTPEGREYSSKTDNVNQDDASNYIASHAAYRDYNLNAVNLVFDTLQLMPLLKGFKNSAVEPLFGKAFATQTEAVLGREATRAEKFLNTGKKVGLLLGEQVSEGVEEGVNALSQMEGNYFGNYLLTGESKDKKARLKEYLADSSTWEQAFWGALGGVAFSGGTRLVNNIREKTNQVEDPYADEVRASEISNRATKINNLASTIKAVQNGDDPETGKKFSGTPQEIEEQKNNKINQLKKEGDYDLALNAIKHGNYNSLIEHINSPSFTDILVNSGLTNKDDIQKAKNHMLSNFREVKESYDAAYNNIFPTKLNPATKQILINNNVRLGGLAKSLYEDNINTEKKIAKLRTQDPYFQTDEYKNNAGEVDAALEVISNNLAIQHIEESIKESNDFVADQARKKIEELKENVKNSQSILDENQKNRDEKKQPALSYNFKNDLAYALARKKINDTYLSTVNAQIYENTKNTEKKGKEIETEINKATRDFETKQREKYNNFINTKTGVSDLTTTLQVLERGEALDEGISGVPLTKNNTKYFSKFVKDKIAKIENEAKVKERKITNRTTVDTSSVEGFTKTSKAYTSLEKKLAAGEFEDAQAQVDSMIKSYTKQENDVWDAKRTKESAEILEFLKKKKVEVDNNLVVASAAPIPTKNESTSNVNEIKGLLDSEEAKEVSALISEKPAIDFTKQANKDARERELQAKTIRVGAKLIKLITDSLGTKEGDNLEFGEIVKFLGDSLGVNYLATNINLLSFAYNYGLNTGMFTGEKVPTKVSVGQALKDYLAKPIETDVPTDNENSNKEVTNIYTDLLFDLEDTDGIITLNKNQEGVIGTLLKDLRVGDLLEVSIDTDNKSKGYSYDETKDDKDRVPLKISYRDTRIAYMNVLPQTHGGIKYLGGDTDVTNLLMDDNILDRLEENFTDFVNLVKGRNIDNPKLDDLLTELINVNEGKIKLKENNIYTNEGLKAIKHLGNIILYGVNLKEKFPSFERDALKSKINSWNFKIKRDIYGSKQFRDLIGTDTKKVITVKVASKSPGSVIFSEDSENKKVLRPLNEVIDSINLVHSRYNTANSIDLDYLYGTGRVHTSSNVDTKGYNGLYVLVPTAQISETGEVTNIPIPITFNSVFGKQHEDEYPEQREYNEKIEDHITKIIRDITSKYSEGERVFDAQLEELGKYVVTSTKANNNYVRIYPDDFRLKIEFTSADVNDQKKVNILIKDDNGTFLNNATLTDKNLRQAVRGMTRSVNLVVKNGKWQYKYDIFTDFDGVEYEYLHWLVKSGAILTDIGAIKDSQGNIISNVSGRGDTPLIINIENPASSNVIKEKAKFNKEITTVTKFAEENKLDKAYQELYDLADKLGIAVKDNTDQPISDRFAGYSPDKVIRVYKNWQNEEVAVKSRLLAHESIHGIFHISEKSDEIYNRLEDFFNSIKDLESADFTVKAILTEIGSAIGRDRKSGLEEIVTYGLTNKNFATFLNNHLSDKNNEKSESLWTSLKNIILEVIEAAGKVLGINTKLDELNSILNDFVKINTEKIEKKENEFGNDLDSDIDTNDIKMAKIGDRISMTPEVAYTFKVTDRIITNLTKINQWEKQIKDSDVLWNKLQKDLGIPKDQIELIKNSEGNNIEEKLSSFLANYSYTVEINTAKGQLKEQNQLFGTENIYNGYRYERYGNDVFYKENITTGETIDITEGQYNNALSLIAKQESSQPTQYYSNLTVPGGTNYTENEIATPSITPSIKGHAQFSTDNGIGWVRSDDRLAEDTKTDNIDGTITDYTGYNVNKIPSGYTIYNKNRGWLRDATGKPLDFKTEKEASDYLNKLINQGITNNSSIITKNDKIIFGHPTIGKSYLKQKGNNDFITLDDDYADEVNAFIDANRGSETRQEYKGRKPKEYNEFMLNLFDRLKVQAKKEGKRLFVSNTNILKERMSEFDKVITIPKDEFKKRFDARGATYGFEDWKSDIDATISKVDKSKVITTKGYLSDLIKPEVKTRRILEVQSDLFQKGRDRESLILNEDEATKKKMWEFKTLLKNRIETLENFKRLHPERVEEIKKREKEIEGNKAVINAFEKPTQNQFLQLLNRDNNWVTFFVKSIIQDSAKKGYEKVLFPSGNTASKVEGHTTLEEFKKQKEDRIKVLEKELIEINEGRNFRYNTLSQNNLGQPIIDNINNEINTLKQELERVETEGFGALKPIYNFYENQVKNILKKNYSVSEVTDEYGNTWNQINLDNYDGTDILLARIGESDLTIPGFTLEEENHLVRNVISRAAILVEQKIKSTTLKDVKSGKEESIKNAVYNVIKNQAGEKELTSSQKQLIFRLLANLKKADSELWSRSKTYLYNIRGIKINDVEDFLKDKEQFEIPKNWDDNFQFEQNIADTISLQVKDYINTLEKIDPTKSYIKDRELVAVKKNDTLSGFPETYSFNQIYPYLVDVMIGLPTKQAMADRLFILGDNFDKSLLQIWDKINRDEEFANTWFSNFSYQKPARTYENYEEVGDIYKAKTDIENSDNFYGYKVSNNWIDDIKLRISQGVFDEEFKNNWANVSKEISNLLREKNTNIDRVSELIDGLFNLINIKVDVNGIKYNINKSLDKRFEAQSTYLNTLENVKKYIDKNDSEIEFTEYKSLRKLADTFAWFDYKNHNTSLINVSGNLVYAYINPNFISNWFKVKNNDADFLEYLTQQAQVADMRYSNYLWNTRKGSNLPNNDKGNPTGFLDFEDIKGVRKVKGLNKDFADSFSYFLYGGRKNTTTESSQEYPEIADNLTKLLYFVEPTFKEGKDTVMYALHSVGDAGHTYFLQSKKIRVSSAKINRESAIWQSLMNIVLKEYETIKDATNLLFEESKDGLVLRKDLPNFPVIKYTGKDGNYLTKEGKPAGEVFKFHNLFYERERGNTETKVYPNDLVPTLFDDLGFAREGLLGENELYKLNQFIENFLNWYLPKTIEDYSEYRAFFEDNTNSKGEKLLKDYDSFEHFITEFALNNIVANVEMQSFFGGNPSAYKGALDFNKRATEFIKTGRDNAANPNETFRAITVKDVLVSSPVYPNDKKGINSTDAQSWITYEEFKKRTKLFGRWNLYKDLFAKIDKGEYVDFSKELYKIQSQKNFYYSNRFDNNSKTFKEVQVKNSEKVLIPQYLSEEMLKVHDFMTINNISQINFESAVKVGAIKIVDIADSNGNLKLNEEELLNGIDNYYYKDLKIQQDEPDHAINKTNKFGVQIGKKFLDNVKADSTYILNGERVTGKELIETYFDTLINIINDNSTKLLGELGIKEQILNVNKDFQTSKESVYKILREEAEDRGSDINTIYSLEDNGEGDINMPIYFSNSIKKNMAILTSLFTNNITNIPLPGQHLTLVSGVFPNTKASQLLESKRNFKGVKYINKIEEAVKKGERDYKLKSTVLENGKVIHAEVLLPAWSKDFYKEGELIDINELPEDMRTMIGYRIPTEDKHSMIVFEVVGFITDGSSSIVLPDEIIKQSGADFDIDTLYTIYKHFKKDEKGKFSTLDIEKSDTQKARENLIIDIIKAVLDSPLHYEELISPSTFEDITRSRNYINKLIGFKAADLNQAFPQDLDKLRLMNLMVRDLKGKSVAQDGLMSIAQLTGMYLADDYTVNVKYKAETKKEYENLYKTYKNKYGKDVEKNDEDKSITIKYRYFYNNPKGDFETVKGKKISLYATQISANILDAVKENLPANVNAYTFNVWRNFANVGVDFIDETKTPFTYASAFINQPILVDLANTWLKRGNVSASSRRQDFSIGDIKRKWRNKLFNQIVSGLNDEQRAGLPFDVQESIIKGEEIWFKEGDLKMLNLNENLPVFSLDELEKGITNKTGNEKFIRKQLAVLDTFENYQTANDVLILATNIFNTDKLGASPNLNTTVRLVNNIKAFTAKDVILIEDKNAALKIYPNAVGLDNEYLFPDEADNDSKYPVLSAYLDQANMNSYFALKQFDIRNTKAFEELIRDISVSMIDRSQSEKAIDKVVNYASVYLLRDLPFFNEVERKDLFGVGKDLNISLNIREDANLDEFKKLSVANQLYLVKGISNNLFISYLEPKINARVFSKLNYYPINYTYNEKDSNPIIESFNKLWYSKNVFEKELARNLVRYSYFNDGLEYGFNSFGKVVPVNILSKEIGYADALREAYNRVNTPSYLGFNGDFRGNFLRANSYDDSLVVVAPKQFQVNSQFGYAIIGKKTFEKQKDYIKNANILRIKVTTKPKFMEMSFEGTFDQVKEGKKTQTTRVTKQDYKEGEIVAIRNPKNRSEIINVQITRVINTETINGKNVPLTGKRIYDFIAQKDITDNHFTREGRDNTKDGKLKHLESLKAAGLLKAETAQVVQFKLVPYKKTVSRDAIYRRYISETTDTAKNIYYYPVNRLMRYEFGEESINPRNNALEKYPFYAAAIENRIENEIKDDEKKASVGESSEDLRGETISDSEKFLKNIEFALVNIDNLAKRQRVFSDNWNLKEANENLAEVNIEALKQGDLFELEKALRYNLAYIYDTLSHIEGKINTYDKKEEFDLIANDQTLQTEFTNTIKYVDTFLASYVKVRDIEEFKAERSFLDINDQVNVLIKDYKAFEPKISSLVAQRNRLVERYFIAVVQPLSTNPEILSGFKDILSSSSDLNIAQRFLDSVGDVDNPLVANLFKRYVLQMGYSNNEINKELEELDEVYNKFANGRSDDAVEKDFVNRFIVKDEDGNPTGFLISEFDELAFNKAKNEFFESIKHLGWKTSKWKIAASKWFKENTSQPSEVNGKTAFQLDQEMQQKFRKPNGELARDYYVWRRATLVKSSEGIYFYQTRPSDKYLNPDFEKIKDEEIYRYLVTKIPGLLNHMSQSPLDEYMLPAVPSGNEDSTKTKVLRELGLYNKNSNYIIGENDEIVKFIPLDFVSKLVKIKPIEIPKRTSHETKEEYERRALKEIEDAGRGVFLSLEEVRGFNREAARENAIYHGKNVSYNVKHLMRNFIRSTTNHKYKRQIIAEFLIAQSQIDDLDLYQKTGIGDFIPSKRKSDKTAKALKKGKGSSLAERYKDWLNMIVYEDFELDEGKLQKFARLLQRYTSFKTLGLNLTNAFNNIAYGRVQIAMEGFSGLHWDTASGLKGEKSTWSGIRDSLANIGVETATSLDGAILKRFNVAETQDERDVNDVFKKNLSKYLFSTNTFFILQHLGEYYMQNKGLFSMLHSHRIVNGKVQSFTDYNEDIRKETLESLLTDKEKDTLNDYIENQSSKDEYKVKKKDYIREFILKNIDEERSKSFVDKVKESKNKSKEDFEKLPTMYEQLEFKDGKAVLKEDAGITEKEIILFINKVVHVNHTIHGIYNKLDAGAMQQYALGRLASQFRKFIRPGWNRRFGSKFGKSFWNEQRNTWDKGSYISAWEFFTKPVKDNFEGFGEEEFSTLRAARNMLRDYMKYARNLKLYWHTLDATEKANVNRTLADFIAMMGIITVGIFLRGLKGEDDDKRLKSDNYFLNLAMYQQSRLYSEFLFYMPFYGWFNESKKILQSPFAGERTLEDITKLFGHTFMWINPFSPEEKDFYSSGIYKGERKVAIDVERIIPLWNQKLKMERIKDYVTYYKLFNPF